MASARMASCCPWLSRPCCCRRPPPPAYIYLYTADMSDSSSSSHCLVCVLFGLCLAFIVILAAVTIYHLNSSDFNRSYASADDPSSQVIAKKRQLPDYVNINIDPCEHFYDFVCDKWKSQQRDAQQLALDGSDDDDYEEKWTQTRRAMHSQLMGDLSNQTFSDERNSTSFIYRFYQLCEQQSPALLLDELERYFANLSHEEPYRSHLTLFNRTISIRTQASLSSMSIVFDPFFQLQSSSFDSSTLTRVHRRPLPPAVSIFPNLTILNQTALKHLSKFEEDLTKLLSTEKTLVRPYTQRYNLDTFIVQRIHSFSDYNRCFSSIGARTTSSQGLRTLIDLLNDFLQSRLRHLNTKSIDKQIRILEKITDNRTLVEHLHRITSDLKTIDQIILLNNDTDRMNSSCLINLLDQLLDQRLRFDELPSMIQLTFDQPANGYFLSDDWPFIVMLYDRLLKKTPMETLVNFAFFDSYRHLIYPYYQPHIDHNTNIRLPHYQEYYGYTYLRSYPNLSCHVHSCWDILHCYHPSFLNRLIDDSNETVVRSVQSSVDHIISRFRLLTEQSDHLYPKEKKLILDELHQIQVHIGHYPSSRASNSDLTPIDGLSEQSSYLHYAQYLSARPYDQEERSYFVEPIYFPNYHSLYLPFGFLLSSNQSFEYHVIKLFFRVLRQHLSGNPYQIECFLRSPDHQEEDWTNSSRLAFNDEHLVYIFLRSKFIFDEQILLDEYLWPFMSANPLMKSFLIDYTANHYCRARHGDVLWGNNTYLKDDVYLMFHCEQASFIKQSKCTIT